MKEIERLERRLLRATARAIEDFELVADGDRILVAVSGGKDSYALLHLLSRLRERAPIRFEITAVNLDQGHPGFPAETLEAHFRAVGVPYRMLRQDTLSIVKRVVPEGGTYCSACSRLRRGILYNAAVEMGCTKIALGHHRDDLLATFFLNLFFGGKLKAMPPKLVTDKGDHIVTSAVEHPAIVAPLEFLFRGEVVQAVDATDLVLTGTVESVGATRSTFLSTFFSEVDPPINSSKLWLPLISSWR